MPQCIAYGCNNRCKDASKGISFFLLPVKNPELLKTWIVKLRLENPPIRESNHICSVHFSEDCFEHDLKAELMLGIKTKHRCKPDAVLTIFFPATAQTTSNHHKEGTSTKLGQSPAGPSQKSLWPTSGSRQPRFQCKVLHRYNDGTKDW